MSAEVAWVEPKPTLEDLNNMRFKADQAKEALKKIADADVVRVSFYGLAFDIPADTVREIMDGFVGDWYAAARCHSVEP